MKYASWGLLVSFSLLTSCAVLGLGQQGGLSLQEPEKERLHRELTGKEYVLASSVYSNMFFGNEKRLLVDARPFDIIDLYNLNGDSIPLRPASGEILAAGTPVEIIDIIYPVGGIQGALGEDGDPTSLTPTAHTWLILRQTSQPTAPELVVVLPKDIASLQAFRNAVQEHVKSPMWVLSWLNNREASALSGIFSKTVVDGMSQAEMLATLGTPKNFADSLDTDAIQWVADYGDIQVTIEGKFVNKVVSLKAEAEVRRQAAMELAKVRAEEARREAEANAAEEARKRAEQELQAAKEEKLHQVELAKLEKQRKLMEAKTAKERAVAAKEAAKAAKARVAREKETQKRRAAEARIASEHAKAEQARLDREQAEQRHQAALAAAAVPDPAPAPVAAAPAQRGPLDLDSGTAAAPVAAAAGAPKARPLVLEAQFQKLSRKDARALGRKNTQGALVKTVRSRGIIRDLGLQANDLVLEFNGKRIKSPSDLQKVLGTLTIKSKLEMRVWRNKVMVSLPQTGKSAAGARRTTLIQLEGN